MESGTSGFTRCRTFLILLVTLLAVVIGVVAQQAGSSNQPEPRGTLTALPSAVPPALPEAIPAAAASVAGREQRLGISLACACESIRSRQATRPTSRLWSSWVRET